MLFRRVGRHFALLRSPNLIQTPLQSSTMTPSVKDDETGSISLDASQIDASSADTSLCDTSISADQPDAGLGAGAPQQMSDKRLLLLLDMNETLLFREQPKDKAAKVRNMVANATIKGRRVFIRPAAAEFITTLSQRYAVATYSSAEFDNINKMMTAILGANNREHLFAEFSRKFCSPDPAATRHYDTVKDLRVIWQQPMVVASGFNETNTIMVDNTLKKIEAFRENAIIVKEFNHTQVMSKSDTELTELMDYLLRLSDRFEKDHFDVRELMKAEPFRDQLAPAETAPSNTDVNTLATEIQGKLSFSGNARVEGEDKADVHVPEQSQSQ